jgi:uncharacterized protein YggE
MMRLRWILLIAALVLGASMLAGVGQPLLGNAADSPGTSKKTITVTGTGKVTAVPDRAGFSFTVETRAATAKAALDRNAAEAAALIAALKNAGVSSDDIQTNQVYLSPQTKPDGTDIVGYVASNSVSAQTTIAKAGALVDAAVAAGANGVSGPNMTRSDQDEQYREALKAAVADAKTKAQALASAGGLTLGNVQTMVEGAQSGGPIPFAAAKAADAVASTPIEPGTQSIEASVTVTYEAG